MKQALILILFVHIGLVFSQSIEDVQNRVGILAKTDSVRFVHDSTGLSLLPQVKVNSCLGGAQHDPVWHVEDLNNDGLKDVIYTDFCGYSHVYIFINLGNEFKEVYHSEGRVVSVQETEGIKKLFILWSSCCCIYYSTLFEINIDQKNKLSKHELRFHYDTAIGRVDPFFVKEKKRSGILRTKPEVNDTIHKHPCFEDEINIGNQIIKLKSKKIFVLKKNKKWRLVYYQEDEENSIIAWMRR